MRMKKKNPIQEKRKKQQHTVDNSAYLLFINVLFLLSNKVNYVSNTSTDSQRGRK